MAMFSQRGGLDQGAHNVIEVLTRMIGPNSRQRILLYRQPHRLVRVEVDATLHHFLGGISDDCLDTMSPAKLLARIDVMMTGTPAAAASITFKGIPAAKRVGAMKARASA